MGAAVSDQRATGSGGGESGGEVACISKFAANIKEPTRRFALGGVPSNL